MKDATALSERMFMQDELLDSTTAPFTSSTVPMMVPGRGTGTETRCATAIVAAQKQIRRMKRDLAISLLYIHTLMLPVVLCFATKRVSWGRSQLVVPGMLRLIASSHPLAWHQEISSVDGRRANRSKPVRD